jgi:hypothetical protein
MIRNHMKKTILIFLVLLNAILLLGQLWPDGAPPFARYVNILTLSLNLVFLVWYWRNRIPK